MNPSTRISQCTLFMLVAVALPLSEASTVKGCGVGSVQTPVTSSGRIVLRMVGNCSEEFVSIELQRENGPAGKHLVPFDIHRRGTIRNSPLGHPDPSLTIVFLDPIGRLETGGDYRLTVRDRTKIVTDRFSSTQRTGRSRTVSRSTMKTTSQEAPTLYSRSQMTATRRRQPQSPKSLATQLAAESFSMVRSQ
jgi:hypothetical protein